MAFAGCREAYGEKAGGDILPLPREGNRLPLRESSAGDQSAGILVESLPGREEMAEGMQ